MIWGDRSGGGVPTKVLEITEQPFAPPVRGKIHPRHAKPCGSQKLPLLLKWEEAPARAAPHDHPKPPPGRTKS